MDDIPPVKCLRTAHEGQKVCTVPFRQCGNLVKSIHSGVASAQVQIQVLLLVSCVTLG